MSVKALNASNCRKGLLTVRKGRSYLEPIHGHPPPPPPLPWRGYGSSSVGETDGDPDTLRNKYGFVMTDCRKVERDVFFHLTPLDEVLKESSTIINENAFLNKLILEEERKRLGKPPSALQSKCKVIKIKPYKSRINEVPLYSRLPRLEPTHGVTKEMARFQAFRAEMKKNKALNARVILSKSTMKAKLEREKRIVELLTSDDDQILQQAKQLLAQDKQKQRDKIHKKIKRVTNVVLARMKEQEKDLRAEPSDIGI